LQGFGSNIRAAGSEPEAQEEDAATSDEATRTSLERECSQLRLRLEDSAHW